MPKHGKIDICYTISDLGFGGAQRQLLRLLEKLDARLFNYSVINLHADLEMPNFKRAGTRIWSLPYRGRGDVAKILHVARILRAENPQVVHAILPSGNWYGSLAAVLARVPHTIVSERSLDNNLQGIRKILYRQIYRLADVIVTNSTANRQHIAALGRRLDRKVVCIPNGYDPASTPNDEDLVSRKRLYGIEDGDFVVGSVTHLTPEKDVACLLRAIHTCRRDFPNLKCLIIGPGPAREELQRLINELRLGRDVVLAGYVDHTEVLSLLNLFDCFVLPSQVEGMPNALMEAMSMGLPCVASKVGGIPELIKEGETGFLFESGNHEGLAEKIALVKENPDLARSLGAQARRRIRERFNLQKMVGAYEKLYTILVQKQHYQQCIIPEEQACP